MAMTSLIDGPAAETNLSGTGEIRLMPDLSTRWNIPWAQREEMVLADMHIKPGEPWEYCPREALRRVAKVLKDEFDMEVNAGFENEFFLLKRAEREGKEEWIPIDSSSYCSTAAFDAVSPLLQEVTAALNSINIEVEQVWRNSAQTRVNVKNILMFTRNARRRRGKLDWNGKGLGPFSPEPLFGNF